MRPQSLVRVAALVTRPGRGGSARDARGVLTVLSVVAYTVVQALALSVAGAPRGLLTAIRRREVLVPVVVATVMPALAGLAFQFPFTGPLITQRPDMLITLLATLVAGIGLVFAVQECCSPLQTRLLCEQQRSTD